MSPTLGAVTLPSINIELAEYSELFMMIAAFIYTLAFILFTLDTATSSSSIRRIEKELALENQPSAIETRKLATVPGQDPAPHPSTRSTEAGSSDGDNSESSKLVDDDMSYLGAARPLANTAVALAGVAVVAHAFAVIARGVAATRWPLGNMYEFLVGAALIVALVYLLALLRRDLRFIGTFVLGLVVAMMVAATIGFPTPIGHVQPALQSPWLAIHVSLAALSIGLFVLTFAMSVLQLLQHRREKAMAQGAVKGWDGFLVRRQFMRLVPQAFSLENWAYRINAVAFVFWTLGPMITGAIWARESWGRYWGWDTKEVWTFVIWVVYAGYLHARATRGWTGTRSAWLSIIGFACIIFNYAVVNVYFPGLHSYAGLPD